MLDNYPPGAAHDPRAPYNQVPPDDTDYDVTVGIYDEDGGCRTVELCVTITTYRDYRYSRNDIMNLIHDEVSSALPAGADFDILDYNEQ